MGNKTGHLGLIGLLALAACGKSGGGGGSSGTGQTGSAFGVVQLLATSPADEAVQVALDATITLEFDADMALDTFGDEDTWLRIAGTTGNVPCTFSIGSSGRVACKPDAELEPETDYTFQLSALTSDLNGRIVDETVRFTFRTFDATPPTVTAFSVANGATGVSRTDNYTLSFDEVVAQTSITDQTLYLRDVFNGRYTIDATVTGNSIVVDPHADLPGDRQFFLVATTGLADRAGNRLETLWQSSFRTASDATPPTVVSTWPTLHATDLSPLVQPTFTFSESMDPATVEAASLLFQDEYGSIIPFAIEANLDQHTLRVRPTVTLQPNRDYTLAFLLGGAAATDVSGNQLAMTDAITFTTGSDATAPAVVQTSPGPGETRVPGVLVADIAFAEDLDETRIDKDTVSLVAGGEEWTSVIELIDDDTVRVTPVLPLPTDTDCTLTIRSGQDGLRDLAGNVLTSDVSISFRTSTDDGSPDAIIMPPDGAIGISATSRISVVFDAPMDPATLTPSTLLVTDDFLTPVPGEWTFRADHRIATFEPSVGLTPNAYYRVRIVSGNTGARRLSGNWFESDRASRFRTSNNGDNVKPSVTATINGIPSSRQSGLVVPPAGFTIDVTTSDSSGQWTDIGSVEVVLEGGVGPDPETLIAAATMNYNSFSVEVPDDAPLAAGDWTLSVRCEDLSGNVGTSATVAFSVDNLTGGAMPFERTQVVWVRADMDRDSNGRSDFADDMLRLGFATDGDPAGTNAYMEKVVLDGILAKTNALYERGPLGQPLNSGSVAIRFSKREPIALPHMQIALGGLDPTGERTRTYGDESTGVLGRAYYDYRNDNPIERNVATSPGLGVFPAEMFLYQARIHQQVYPSFQTTFAGKFLAICADMGGTPCGSDPHDPVVLSETFDYATASTSERARFNAVMAAADDWVSVIGVILAHEVGHSVGLVAPGGMPTGLFGDSSLHDTYAGAAEVMAASVGYEAMATLDYKFRDIDLAYLRQRVLLR